MITFLVTTIFLFNLLLFCIVLYNYFTAPVFSESLNRVRNLPFVSILVPLRNEEKNIEELAVSLLNQKYPRYEIIFLDDESTDNTNDLLYILKQKNKMLKVLRGEPLPIGWKGKNWACHQMSEYASGDYFLFLDADVRIGEDVLKEAISIAINKKTGLLSLFPTQINITFGESLVTPLINWLLLTFLPLKKVYSSPKVAYIAANGQFMLFKRADYLALGGHESVKNEVVEDMEFARKFKSKGVKIQTMLGGDMVFVRMYSSYNEAINGFTKNFFRGFNISAKVFSLMLILFFFIFLFPFVAILFKFEFFYSIILILSSRFFISSISGDKILLNLIAHPLQMLIMLNVGLKSILGAIKNNVEWKGRKV